MTGRPDIMERLKIYADEYFRAPPLILDAMDEIERLRAALRKIADDGKNCMDHCRAQARAALAPSTPAKPKDRT